VKTRGPVHRGCFWSQGRHAAMLGCWLAGWQALCACSGRKTSSTSRLRWPAGSPGSLAVELANRHHFASHIGHSRSSKSAPTATRVARLNSQQIARVDAPLAPGLHAPAPVRLCRLRPALCFPRWVLGARRPPLARIMRGSQRLVAGESGGTLSCRLFRQLRNADRRRLVG